MVWSRVCENQQTQASYYISAHNIIIMYSSINLFISIVIDC